MERRELGTEKIVEESGFSIKEWHCSSPELQEIVNTKGEIKLPEETEHANAQLQSEKNPSPKSTEVNPPTSKMASKR